MGDNVSTLMTNQYKYIQNHQTSTEQETFENQALLQGFSRRPLTDDQILQLPFCMVGQLHSEFLANNSRIGSALDGTACLVAPDLILTAAHNIFVSNYQRKLPTVCNFTLALHKNQGRTTTVLDYRLPAEFKGADDNNEESRKNDYALLKVKPFLSKMEVENLEFLTFLQEKLSVGDEVSVFGYPIDNNLKLNPVASPDIGAIITQQFGSSGKVISHDKFVTYQISTSSGQSGCPVFYKNKANRYEIVGVHKGVIRKGDKTMNYGVSFSREMRQNLDTWAFEMGSNLPKKKEKAVSDIYEGEVIEGRADGKGVLRLLVEEQYEGEFKNDQFHGKGTYSFANGDKYIGSCYLSKKFGRGVYFFANGDRYEGEWKNDKKDGKGIYFYADGDKYYGDWKNDMKVGHGTFSFANGFMEEGEYIEDRRHGVGTMTRGDIKSKTTFKMGVLMKEQLL